MINQNRLFSCVLVFSGAGLIRCRVSRIKSIPERVHGFALLNDAKVAGTFCAKILSAPLLPSDAPHLGITRDGHILATGAKPAREKPQQTLAGGPSGCLRRGLALCFFGATAHALTEHPPYPYGAPGDAGAVDGCEAGWYIVGFRVRSGLSFDSIGVICARRDATGNAYVDDKVVAMRGGPGGGAPTDYRCNADEVVKDIFVFADDPARRVNNMQATCSAGPTIQRACHQSWRRSWGKQAHPRPALRRRRSWLCTRNSIWKGRQCHRPALSSARGTYGAADSRSVCRHTVGRSSEGGHPGGAAK